MRRSACDVRAALIGLLVVAAVPACKRFRAAPAPGDASADGAASDASSAVLAPTIEVDASTGRASAPASQQPAWATGDLSARLRALGVGEDDWARRELYSWTTRGQVEEMRTSRVLLVAEASTNGPPSPFVFLVDSLSRKKGPVAALAKILATDPRFTKRRYAWTAAYATVLGLLQKRYGDELVGVRLREDAWVIMLDPAREPKMRVRDLSQKPVPIEQALAQPERVGAVYHVRTGKDVPKKFREYVLVNEAAVERWAVGTPDVRGEVDGERMLLRDVRARLDMRGGRGAALDHLWRATLAFENDRYGKLDAKHLDLTIAGLDTFNRTAPEIDVAPRR